MTMTDSPDLALPVNGKAASVVGGWTFALLSTLAFSLSTPIAKAAYALGLTPTVMLVLRFLVAALLLFLTGLVVRGGPVPLDRRAKLIAFGSGLMHGVGTLAFYWALTSMDSSISSMIFALYPLVVLGMLALRGERFTYRNVVRMALGLAGVYLLIGPGGQVSVLGLVLVGISIVASAAQTVISQWYLKPYDPQATLLYLLAGMTTITALYGLVNGPPLVGLVLALTPALWGVILFMAAITTYFAWAAWFIAMRRLGTGPVAMLVPLETFLSVIWSVLFLSERLTPLQWLGGVLILLSTLLAIQRLGRVRLWRWRSPPQV